MSSPSLRMTTTPSKERGQGHMTHFPFRSPRSYLRNGWSTSRQISYTGRMYQVLAFRWKTTL